MASLRSTSFCVVAVTNTTRQDLYTVPAGHRIILKDITLRNQYSGSNTFKLNVQRGAANLGLFVVTVAAGPSSNETSHWIVLDPADILWANVSNATGIAVALSGSLLYI